MWLLPVWHLLTSSAPHPTTTTTTSTKELFFLHSSYMFPGWWPIQCPALLGSAEGKQADTGRHWSWGWRKPLTPLRLFIWNTELRSLPETTLFLTGEEGWPTERERPGSHGSPNFYWCSPWIWSPPWPHSGTCTSYCELHIHHLQLAQSWLAHSHAHKPERGLYILCCVHGRKGQSLLSKGIGYHLEGISHTRFSLLHLSKILVLVWRRRNWFTLFLIKLRKINHDPFIFIGCLFSGKVGCQ